MWQKKRLKFISLLLISLSCGVQAAADEDWDDLSLVFRSGFEPDSELYTPPSGEAWRDIRGVDYSVLDSDRFIHTADWDALDQHPWVGDFKLDLKEGFPENRDALIVRSPQNIENRALYFVLNTPNQGSKGRVQSNLSLNYGVREIYQRVKFYLHPDFTLLQSMDSSFTWLTLFEFWNDPDWGSQREAPFRIKIDVQKLSAKPDAPLTWGVTAQIMEPDHRSKPVWKSSEKHPVQIGQWLTAEIYFREGDAQTGRFYFALTDEYGVKTVICDVHDFTRHEFDPSPNDGIPFFNPMKLYTRSDQIRYVHDHGGALQVYWDDWSVYMGEYDLERKRLSK